MRLGVVLTVLVETTMVDSCGISWEGVKLNC